MIAEHAATPRLTYSQATRDLLATMRTPGMAFWLLLALDLAVLAWGARAWLYQIQTGMGVAGINHPVGWGVYIATFVFWIGIAHSGTLISAILFLCRAGWRPAVYRSAEAMTVFAIITAGLFPIIHLGRAWKFYWVFPYPNDRLLWVNFRSPLIWDVFAIGTYMLVSVMFFTLGLIPDLAVARSRATGWRRRLYRALSLGWRGTDNQWHHYRAAYLFFAALATPLVISVHSVVSWDFAATLVPGWHSTLFAPYFVAGAIHSGLAMVLTILIPLRRAFRLEAYVTPHHLGQVARLMVLTGLIMAYSYAAEFFFVGWRGTPVERELFRYRVSGDYALGFWLMVIFNTLIPLLFALRAVRVRIWLIFALSLLVNVGMWTERFVIFVTSLAHEYLPFAWGTYRPTWVELSVIAGSFAWFFFWFLLFAKLLPVVSLTEVKEALGPEAAGEAR
ncbi:MAG: polysulfide reductase NrfD [Deltaproteobacteria bacterium]|nr:polysulfide reductase NrfD [Deltaproteobacteria bacterium]